VLKAVGVLLGAFGATLPGEVVLEGRRLSFNIPTRLFRGFENIGDGCTDESWRSLRRTMPGAV